MNELTRVFQLLSIRDNKLKTRYEENVANTNDTHLITYENTLPIHSDLFDAVQLLASHVAGITGLILVGDMIRIGGYQRQNIGDAQLLTIYAALGPDATVRTAAGNLSVRLYIGRDEYPEIDLLLEDLSRCEREANLYITKGKTFEQNAFVCMDADDINLIQTAA